MKICELALREFVFGQGQLVIVGGRPAMGKTAFAISLSLDLAEKGYRLGYFSLEMDKEHWLRRAGLRIDGDVERIKSIPIDIIDDISFELDEIESICASKKYDMVIIDYIQLLPRGDGGMGDMIKQLKYLADKLKCPVIVLSQLNRDIDKRENHKPHLEDLTLNHIDLSLLNQVFLLYREYYYDESADDSEFFVITKENEEKLNWDYNTISVV